MLGRALTLAGGLAGAAGLSQFPEFSQQYVQRLGGAVDELSRFVTEFDADAAEAGLTRPAALADLGQGSAMGAQRADTMAGVIVRYERLSADLAALRGSGPFIRAARMRNFADAEIAGAAWEDFQPAVPLTLAGAVFAGAGFLAGMTLIGCIMAVLRAIFGRKRARLA